MTLTATEKDSIERVHRNLADFEYDLQQASRGQGSFNGAMWAGVFSINLAELLALVDRLAAAELVPSGTGWPVP